MHKSQTYCLRNDEQNRKSFFLEVSVSQDVKHLNTGWWCHVMFNKINRNNNDYINKMNKQVNQNNPINNRDDISIKIIIASEVI